jgi:hypothetical protein
MRKRDFFAILLLILTLVAFFNKLIFSGEVFITGDFLKSDTLNQNLPFKLNYFESINRGLLPLWTEGIFGGFPQLAEGQTGVFYPINLILFSLFDFLWAYNLSVILNFLVASAGMYFWARSFKLSYLSSFFTSLVFTFSSVFVLHITHQNIIAAACWTPWVFLLNKKFFETKNKRFFFLSIIAFFLSFLGGSTQITFYIAVALLIYLVIFKKTFKYSLLNTILFFVLELVLATLISAIQLVPLLELIAHSTRTSGLGNVALESLPYHPRNLITLVSPHIFGDPGRGTYPYFGGNWGMFWENTLYLGIIPVLLSIGSIFLVRSKKELGKWLIFLIVIFLLVLGKFSPTFFVYYLPVFNYFRVTTRFLFIISFILSLLSGITLDYFFSIKKLCRYSLFFGIGAIILTIFDLFYFGYPYNPTEKLGKVLAPPEIVGFFDKNKDEGSRVFTVGGNLTYDFINKHGWRNNNTLVLNHSNSLDTNLNMLWGIDSLDGYAGLFSSDFQAFKNIVFSGIEFRQDQKIQIKDSSLKLLGVGSVEYLISSFELINPHLSWVGDFGSGVIYKLYKNSYYLKKGVLFDYSTNNLTEFLDSSFDKSIYLETEALTNLTDNQEKNVVSKEGVLLKEDRQTKLVFDVSSPSSGWFYLSNSYYPGWKAYVDGLETPIFKANIMFQAVRVPQGTHEVAFKYEPASYFYGFAISLLTTLLLTGWWVFSELRRKIV